MQLYVHGALKSHFASHPTHSTLGIYTYIIYCVLFTTLLLERIQMAVKGSDHVAVWDTIQAFFWIEWRKTIGTPTGISPDWDYKLRCEYTIGWDYKLRCEYEAELLATQLQCSLKEN
jgi:hypothetical protein